MHICKNMPTLLEHCHALYLDVPFIEPPPPPVRANIASLYCFEIMIAGAAANGERGRAPRGGGRLDAAPGERTLLQTIYFLVLCVIILCINNCVMYIPLQAHLAASSDRDCQRAELHLALAERTALLGWRRSEAAAARAYHEGEVGAARAERRRWPRCLSQARGGSGAGDGP